MYDHDLKRDLTSEEVKERFLSTERIIVVPDALYDELVAKIKMGADIDDIVVPPEEKEEEETDGTPE